MSITIDLYRNATLGNRLDGAYPLGDGTSGGGGSADYPLEIIQPRPSLTTDNRFYKQYTGIEYNVRLGVIGGIYENYVYSLVTAPSGMTINSGTGEITWPNPVESGSPHTVTARVTDGSETQDITWTLSVGTTGFKFVDSVGGSDSNDGSLASPWATLGKVSDAANTDHIYFRAGTYASTAQTSWDNKASVWMAYPSESVSFDFALGGYFMSNASNRIYIDGLDFNINTNSTERGISYAGTESNVTFRRNSFTGLSATGGNNGSYLFSTNSSTQGQHIVLQDNLVTGGSGSGYFYLGYANSRVLVEDNTITGFAGSAAISPKDGNDMWFVRGNTTSVIGRSVSIQEYDSQLHGRGPVVIEYNNFEETAAGNAVSMNAWNQNTQVIVQRNTVRGRFYVRPTSASNGPLHFNKNVIINDDSSYTDRIRTGPEGDQGVMFYDDNLVGGTADNIVDSNGDLQGSYRTSNLGTHGYEVV